MPSSDDAVLSEYLKLKKREIGKHAHAARNIVTGCRARAKEAVCMRMCKKGGKRTQLKKRKRVKRKKRKPK